MATVVAVWLTLRRITGVRGVLGRGSVDAKSVKFVHCVFKHFVPLVIFVFLNQLLKKKNTFNLQL